MAVSEIIPAEEGRGLYRALAFRRILVICGLIVALAFSFSLDLALGPARYPCQKCFPPWLIRPAPICRHASSFGTFACRSR